jgi:NADPH2:quinone reductase
MNVIIPQMMNAIQMDEPKGKLIWRKIPVPHLQPGQVLIRMAAAPINPSDLGALLGKSYGDEHTYPFTPGVEGSGTVVEAGKGFMPRLLEGRRVACTAQTTAGGTWAEYMVTSAKSCIPLHKNISLEQGATMIVNPLTALAIFQIAKHGNHHAIVSTAAASSLGRMILCLGKRRQMPIIHVVRRQEQVEMVRNRGGEHILNSSEADFVEQLKKMADQLQATLFLDAVGDGMTQQLVEAAPFGSTILLYSNLSTHNSIIDPSITLVKNLHLDGWFLPNWINEKNLFQVIQLSQQVQSLMGSDLQTFVQQRFPLSATMQGVDQYVLNMSAGKILLVADQQEIRLHN